MEKAILTFYHIPTKCSDCSLSTSKKFNDLDWKEQREISEEDNTNIEELMDEKIWYCAAFFHKVRVKLDEKSKECPLKIVED